MRPLVLAALALLLSAPAYAQSRSVGVGVGVSASRSAAVASASGGTSTTSINSYSAGQAPAVFAPGLSAAGIESCNGSVSLGGAAVGGGGALGFPWQDGPCNKRLNARTLWAFGQHEAALQTLCLDEELASAMVASGISCKVGHFASGSPAGAPAPVYVNRRGQSFVRVACGTKGARPSADVGVCVRPAL